MRPSFTDERTINMRRMWRAFLSANATFEESLLGDILGVITLFLFLFGLLLAAPVVDGLLLEAPVFNGALK